jgi:hypothetical protein
MTSLCHGIEEVAREILSSAEQHAEFRLEYKKSHDLTNQSETE